MRHALYTPGTGYYMRPLSPVGPEGDFVTSPQLSPIFAFGLSGLVREFVQQGNDEVSHIVDVGCGDGSLIYSLFDLAGGETPKLQFAGVDASLARLREDRGTSAIRFTRSISELPVSRRLTFSNELFDALPFARLVMRPSGLHELFVREHQGSIDWTEHPADSSYLEYFRERSIVLEQGQFADISLEWSQLYEEMARGSSTGLIVTFDYGMRGDKLFRSRMRRYGTAAAYRRQRVSRDLLANPGQQDLTAHVNFSDLEAAGALHGFQTLFFDSQAKFLLALGVTEHELFAPLGEVETTMARAVELLDARDRARRLVLPDGIGEEIRVLVQGKEVAENGWSFQRPLF